MKRPYLLLLIAAVLSLTACNNHEIDFQKKNYLPVVHGTVGTTHTKAEKTLKRNGFRPAPNPAEAGTIHYVNANRDSTIVMDVVCSLVNDTVKTYTLKTSLKDVTNCAQASTLYADWSRYAYSTIFAEISIWSGLVTDALADTTVFYLDGGLASMVKNMIYAYYLSGQLEEETYQMIMAAFENKRADYEPILKEPEFLRDRTCYEMFAHATSVLDLTTIMTNFQNLKGVTGALTTETATDPATGKLMWQVTFVYNGEKAIMDILGSFM